MRKIQIVLGSLVSAALLSSCSITLPVAATSNQIGNKVGKSSGSCFLTAFCFGVDASIQTAARNGGISKISTVDYTQKNILGIVITHETTVTGE
jgi:hypothetical protein